MASDSRDDRLAKWDGNLAEEWSEFATREMVADDAMARLAIQAVQTSLLMKQSR
eukprot:CAMPEP_0197417478 /NCGR_PEP_ID=MMETSP1170-20131217/3504_1 /TAXON_ID=54406 /ORGANISM="Sarcinochrysis sp, Strain CCMP770" /LENGTH=53 /DNA_ID=CAMNT_0042944447 /DNA_START=18 /DNA_END=175 /DNA_ORIENTATION=-